MSTTAAFTTVFSPDASCYSPGLLGSANAYSFSYGTTTVNYNHISACYPSSTRGFQIVFSPGWCPIGFTTARVTTSGAVTSAICCPM